MCMTFSFVANKRGKEEVNVLRAERKLPAVLYGPGLKPVSLTVDYNLFMKLYNEAGEASLIDLVIDDPSTGAHGKPVKVLIQDLQHDPVKGVITHVDFRQIDMNKEMRATVELVFAGESAAVKELGGTLVKAKDTVEIKCLPKDLVNEITVDLSLLKTFADVLHVKDLPVPAGMTLIDNPDTVIVKVAAPLTEEQLKAMEEEGKKGVEAVEVAEKEKKEEGTEGEGGEDGKKKDEGGKEEKEKKKE